jgi:hypothetical protein
MSPVPDDRFAGIELPTRFAWGLHGPITDPITMEYALEDAEPVVRNRLVVLRLETYAKIYGALAESAAEAARIHAQGTGD